MAPPASRGVVKKPPTSIYTVMMAIATVAMALGCLFLALEKARYL
ncbi:hypothetical protein [Botrimarina sp.]